MVGPKCSSNSSLFLKASAQSTTNTVGVTPNPPSVCLPVNVLSDELFASSTMADVNRSAIPLFSSGATAIVAK